MNGSLPNGILGSASPDMYMPSIEISHSCKLESSGPRLAISLTGLDIQDDLAGSHSPSDTPRQSLSPVMPPLSAGSALTPGRKSMEALKKVQFYVQLSLCGHLFGFKSFVVRFVLLIILMKMNV